MENSSDVDAINTFRKMSVIQHFRDLIQQHESRMSMLEKRLMRVGPKFNPKTSEAKSILYLVDCVNREWQRKADEFRRDVNRKATRLSEEKAALEALIEKRKTHRVIQFTKQKDKLKVDIQSLSASIDSIRLKLNQPKEVAVNDIKKAYQRYLTEATCLNQVKSILADYCRDGLKNVTVREYVLKLFKDPLQRLAWLQSALNVQQQTLVVKVVTLIYVLRSIEDSERLYDRLLIQCVFKKGRWPALTELGLDLTSLVGCITQPRTLLKQVGLNFIDPKIRNLFKIRQCSSTLSVARYLMFFEDADRAFFLNSAVNHKSETELKKRIQSYFSVTSIKEAFCFYAVSVSFLPVSLLFFYIAAILKQEDSLINDRPVRYVINIVLWTAVSKSFKAWSARQKKRYPYMNVTLEKLVLLWSLTTIDLTRSFSTAWLLMLLLGSELLKAACFVSWMRSELKDVKRNHEVADGQVLDADNKAMAYLMECESEPHGMSSCTWKTF